MIDDDLIPQSQIEAKLLEIQLRIETIAANIQQLKHRNQLNSQSQTVSSPTPKTPPKSEIQEDEKKSPQFKPSPIPSGPPLW